MKIEVGVYRGDEPTSGGWLRVCEQEKLPFRVTSEPHCPIMLFEGETPAWLENFIRQGGVALITEADASQLPFKADYRGQAIVYRTSFPLAQLEDVVTTSIASLFQGSGWGTIRIHDKRVTKYGVENGVYPVWLQHNLGRGTLLYTGLSLSRLLTVGGDTLRKYSSLTEMTERVVAVDKWKIARILVWSLQKAFELADLPYVHAWYYPEGVPSVFTFRIDVDGAYGNNLVNISEVGERIGLPITFFINKSLCQDQVDVLKSIHPRHEIGNHGDIHNLFDTTEDNKQNVLTCKEWLDAIGVPNGPWYAAPRGMWNLQLGIALEELGYLYSADFGIDIDGLPFFPRINDQKLSVLQIPVHPYSVERATVYAQEQDIDPPRPDKVLHYFLATAQNQLSVKLPICLYSHPQYFGAMAEQVLPELKATVEEWGVQVTTLSRFYEWWKQRDGLSFDVEYHPQSGDLTVQGDLSDELYFNILSKRNLSIKGSVAQDHILTNYLAKPSNRSVP
jgi:peptidoglycan/xylan/chitin deacetylase (PgdA/CDA1 family)